MSGGNDECLIHTTSMKTVGIHKMSDAHDSLVLEELQVAQRLLFHLQHHQKLQLTLGKLRRKLTAAIYLNSNFHEWIVVRKLRRTQSPTPHTYGVVSRLGSGGVRGKKEPHDLATSSAF